jgi:TadE-like protein
MIRSLRRCERGASAAEFALVLPATLFLFFGAFNLCVVLYAQSCLQAATEAAARYASIQTAMTGSAPAQSAVQGVASGRYKGPRLGSLSFTCPSSNCAASGCGHTVSGTGTYKLNYGLGRINLTLSTRSCFP